MTVESTNSVQRDKPIQRDKAVPKPEKYVLLQKFPGEGWSVKCKGQILPSESVRFMRMLRVGIRQHRALLRIKGIKENVVL